MFKNKKSNLLICVGIGKKQLTLVRKVVEAGFEVIGIDKNPYLDCQSLCIKTIKCSTYESKKVIEELRKVLKEGGELINKQAVSNAQFALKQAQENYKKAFDEGDTQAMADAQAAIAKASYTSNFSFFIFRDKIDETIYFTCSLDALPFPTTDILIFLGEYS